MIANLDKLTAAFKSSAEEAAEANAKNSATIVDKLEKEREIMEARGASADELYKQDYKIYLAKRTQLKDELNLLKTKIVRNTKINKNLLQI